MPGLKAQLAQSGCDWSRSIHRDLWYTKYPLISAGPGTGMPEARAVSPVIWNLREIAISFSSTELPWGHCTASNLLFRYGIQWTESPVAMTYRKPYLIGVLNKSLEVRTIEPRALIQTIELDKPRFISHMRYLFSGFFIPLGWPGNTNGPHLRRIRLHKPTSFFWTGGS